MRALIQRVRESSVEVSGETIASVGSGILILLGVSTADSEEDADWLAKKIAGLRIFNDEAGVMNLNVTQVGGEILVVSQFTLLASTKKGNRPSYVRAAAEPVSRPLYEYFAGRIAELSGCRVATGRFGADMQVRLINDGPVTIWIDSQDKE